MKVLFLYTNINGFHQDSYGDGIAQIMAVTKRAGHDLRQLQVFEKSQYAEVSQMVEEYKPDVVGFTAVSSQFSFVKDLSEIIKKINPKIINVCGGVHTTLYPQCVLESEYLDTVFIGDSEHPFLDFLNKVENNLSWKDCDNIAFTGEDGKMKKNKLRKLLTNEELEQLPHPDRSTYPFSKVMQKIGMAPFHFTRGCPFTCSYCSKIGLAKVYGQTRYNIRQASPEYAIEEILQTIKENPTIGPVYKIYITDDIFGLNAKWRREFLALYREKVKVPFVCLLRCDVATEDTIKDLAKGYCHTIQFGVESGSDYIRNTVMSRSMKRDTIVNAFKLTKKYGVRTNAINIIGVPGETKEMLEETVALNKEIMPDSTGVNIFFPYKGTPLGDKCFTDGFVNLEKYNDFSNERRESVLNFDYETLERLKWYKLHWNEAVYPRTFSRLAFKGYHEFKQQVKKIPIFGPIIQRTYQKRKENFMMNKSKNDQKRNKINPKINNYV